MKKRLFAAAFAAAILPLASVTADAASPATMYTRNYWVTCVANASAVDGELRMRVVNSGGRTIPRGATIILTINGGEWYATRTAHREVGPGGSILVYQPRGVKSCYGKVILPRIDKKIITRR